MIWGIVPEKCKTFKLKQIFKQKTFGSGRLGIPRGTYKKRIKKGDSEFDHPMDKPVHQHQNPTLRAPQPPTSNQMSAEDHDKFSKNLKYLEETELK